MMKILLTGLLLASVQLVFADWVNNASITLLNNCAHSIICQSKDGSPIQVINPDTAWENYVYSYHLNLRLD